jgi:hypothetical protein
MKTREAFHKLIDEIGDEAVLQSYYQLISVLSEKKEGELWNGLSGEEKAELLVSYEESLDEENLIDHNVVMEKHLTWRKK